MTNHPVRYTARAVAFVLAVLVFSLNLASAQEPTSGDTAAAVKEQTSAGGASA